MEHADPGSTLEQRCNSPWNSLGTALEQRFRAVPAPLADLARCHPRRPEAGNDNPILTEPSEARVRQP
jgi:hypothetical protein